jgi:hypothetical protein
MLLSHGSGKECAQGILGENISIFRGKYTYFELGETAFIRL